MKIIYCINCILGTGGMERVLVDRANYLVEKFNYEVYIVTSDEKNDKEPEEWINSQYKSNQARKEYLEKNYIPENIELTITNYEEFFRRREELIFEKLKEILLEK